jgi:hypothetical protein
VIDCMTCLVNVARGLEVEEDLRIPWRGTNHAVVVEMRPGRVAVACRHRMTNPYGSHVEWRHKGRHG